MPNERHYKHPGAYLILTSKGAIIRGALIGEFTVLLSSFYLKLATYIAK